MPPFFSGGTDVGTAKSQLDKTNSYGSTFAGNAGAGWNALFPTLVGEATNPKGLSENEKANERTAASQSIGGSMAGAVGGGNLAAERTHNPGAFGEAITSSVKKGGEAVSRANLGVEESSANLAHKEQQTALAELGSLYGTNVSGLNDMMKAASENLKTYESAYQGQGSILGDIGQINNMVGGAVGDISGIKGLIPK